MCFLSWPNDHLTRSRTNKEGVWLRVGCTYEKKRHTQSCFTVRGGYDGVLSPTNVHQLAQAAVFNMTPSPEPNPASALAAALRLAFTCGYGPHQQPQLASVDLCNACRESVPVSLTLTDRMPPSLESMFFQPHHPSRSLGNCADSGRGSGSGGGLPCCLSAAHTSRLTSYQRVESIDWAAVDVPIRDVVSWPKRVQRLSFVEEFNQDLRWVLWPEGLLEMIFREGFNMPIEGIKFPNGLTKLSLGADFDQPVENAAFPPDLTYLLLGAAFNHPIEGTKWPKSLSEIIWGDCFDQPIEGVCWPPSLGAIKLGDAFNFLVEQSVFPRQLESLQLGDAFDQAVEGVTFPPLIAKLAFGHQFNRPVTGVFWPEGLKEVRKRKKQQFGNWYWRHQSLV